MHFILCFGNPKDGFEYVGPFEVPADAQTHAEQNYGFTDWWVIQLQAPEDGDNPCQP